MMLFSPHTLMLAHLIQQSNNAEDGERKYSDSSQRYGPAFSVIKTLNEQHETENGNEDGDSEKREFHIQFDLMQK
jgi:hypothetical protein